MHHREAIINAFGAIVDSGARRRYQRINVSVYDRIVNDGFDPLLFMPLVVNRRPDGVYVI